MVDEIIFMVPWPITARDVSKFGLEYLKGAGFGVRVFDLSMLLNKDALRRHPSVLKEAVDGGYAQRFASYRGLDAGIKEAAPCAAFMDYLTGPNGIDYPTERVYRLLKIHGARYYIVSSGPLPYSGIDAEPGPGRRLSMRLRRAADPKKLLGFLARRVIRVLTRRAIAYPLPAGIFSGESGTLERYLAWSGMDRSCVVPIHSFDHDAYLGYMRGIGFNAPRSERICVFIDEAATRHPDFAILGIRPIGEERYFKSMNAFFDMIEKKTGLRVVIAAHPRANYEDTPNAFGNREMIKGKTIELAARSSMVVAHSSTAVSFAVLFDKPLILAKTQEMVERRADGLIDAMAAALGVVSVNIDDASATDRLSLAPSAHKGKRFEAYKYQYVKSRAASDATTWEIVAQHLRDAPGRGKTLVS
ncbi:MAG: hypothetical protein HY894_09725 [Deltaproteobacteria bacterium]|nr:hypothetical protein [Deltaproteobacteria bacterium]